MGTFVTVYPAYRSFYTDLLVNAAHNDYVQFLVETGLIGFACVQWFIVILYHPRLQRLEHWGHSWRGVLRLGALAGCTGIVVHSFFDFNLQVPANAALFFVLAGIATDVPTGSEPLILTSVRIIRRRARDRRG